jgi:hypothetical protein
MVSLCSLNGFGLLAFSFQGAKIIQVQCPTTVTYGSSGTIDIKVHVQAAFGSPNEAGEYGVLLVAILNLDYNSSAISGADVTTTSQPIPCIQEPASATPKASCAIAAFQASYDEIFDFTFGNTDPVSSASRNNYQPYPIAQQNPATHGALSLCRDFNIIMPTE